MSNSVMHPDDECRPVGSITPPPFAVGQEVWVRAEVVMLHGTSARVSFEDIDGDCVRGWVHLSSLRHTTTTNGTGEKQ